MTATPTPAKRDGRRRQAGGKGYKIAGTVLPWDPDLDLRKPVPTPLFPVSPFEEASAILDRSAFLAQALCAHYHTISPLMHSHNPL